MSEPPVAGIDLAASPRRTTGLAVISNGIVETVSAYSDEEVLSWLLSKHPWLVAVDAPLNLPSDGRWVRNVDRAMMSRGFRVLPPSWRHMRELTLRAMTLSSRLVRAGVKAIETHPRSSLRSSGCEDYRDLAKLMRVSIAVEPVNRHEKDAIIAALTALAALRGLTEVVEADDGAIYLITHICQGDIPRGRVP